MVMINPNKKGKAVADKILRDKSEKADMLIKKSRQAISGEPSSNKSLKTKLKGRKSEESY